FYPLRPHTPRSTLFPYTTLFRSGLDPLFTLAAARELGGVEETVFLGLADGAARFAVALDQATIEALKARDDLTVTDLRSIAVRGDRKSTRLNSSHVKISYAVFCL